MAGRKAQGQAYGAGSSWIYLVVRVGAVKGHFGLPCAKWHRWHISAYQSTESQGNPSPLEVAEVKEGRIQETDSNQRAYELLALITAC